jgi:tRNA(His) guanylyltransferase
MTREEVAARRRRIKVDFELPMKDQYSDFILNLIEDSVESE